MEIAGLIKVARAGAGQTVDRVPDAVMPAIVWLMRVGIVWGGPDEIVDYGVFPLTEAEPDDPRPQD